MRISDGFGGIKICSSEIQTEGIIKEDGSKKSQGDPGGNRDSPIFVGVISDAPEMQQLIGSKRPNQIHQEQHKRQDP